MFIFVYGTLKRGQRNHNLLSGARFITSARTQPRYQLFDLGPYPALVAAMVTLGTSILGEIYDVSEDLLPILDDFEGCPNLFDRAAIELVDFAHPVEAYFYQRAIRPGSPVGDQWPMYLA